MHICVKRMKSQSILELKFITQELCALYTNKESRRPPFKKYSTPSGFVSQLGGGFRWENIRHMNPTVGRKVVHTFSVAQAQKKYFQQLVLLMDVIYFVYKIYALGFIVLICM